MEQSSATYYAGAIPGEFGVDQNGNATYSIAIQVPPGTGGMAPSLSLAYHSALSDGMLGPGWALNGLSAVLRAGKNPSQDSGSFRQSVRYDASDRLVLNGVRLVAVSGEYGGPSTIYHTEIQSWQRIGAVANGFVAQSGNGLRQEYGITGDAQIRTGGPGTPVRVWAVSRVTDACGNFMTVSYQRDPNTAAYYPSRIAYTGNKALQPSRAVEFVYEDRPDIQPRFESGCPVHETRRLKQIKTSLDGRTVLVYTMEYETGKASGRGRLQQVTLADAEGRALPATRFGWLDMDQPVFQAGEPLPVPGVAAGSELIPCDLNGTGRRDLIAVAPSAYGRVSLTLMIASESGGFLPPVKQTIEELLHSPGCILPLDVDGDGATELVHVGQLNNKLSLTLLRASAKGGAWKVESGPRGAAGPADLNFGGRLIPLDVDGDGLIDLAYCLSNAGKMQVRLLCSNGSVFQPAGVTDTNLSLDPGVQLIAADYNGDGMTDLLYAYADQGKLALRVLLSAGRKLELLPGNPLPADVKPNFGGALLPVRLKADDQDDLVYAHADNDKLVLHALFGAGDGYRKATPQPLQTSLGYTGWTLPMAMRGAGLTELAVAASDAAGNLDIRMLRWNGTAFRAPEPCTAEGERKRLAGAQILPADMNGQGKSDLVLAASKDGNLNLTVLRAPAVVPDRISVITDGCGARHEIAYRPLTDPGVYSKDDAAEGGTALLDGQARVNAGLGGSVWPLKMQNVLAAATRGSAYSLPTRQFAEYVVASHSVSDGRGNTYRSEYRYRGCRIDPKGRGWLGFSSREVRDIEADTTTTERYHQVFPATSSVASTTVQQTSTGHLLTRQSLTYQTGSQSGVYRHEVTNVRTENFTPGKSAPDTVDTQTRAYDAYGNITRSSFEPSAGLPEFTLQEFSNSESDWRLGRLTRRSIVADAAGTQVFGREEFQHDPATGKTVRSSIWDSQTQSFIVTSRTFDDFGNETSVTDHAGAVTRSEYDTRHHTFLTRQIPPATGEAAPAETRAEYDAAFGERTSFQDGNGLRQVFELDGLGRVVEIQGPDPNGNLVALIRNSWGTGPDGCYSERRNRLDWSADRWHWERIYIDGLRREWRKSMPAPGGQDEIRVDRTFTREGQVLRESLPYRAVEKEPALWIETSYDPAGRMIGRKEPVADGGSRETRIDYPHVNREVRVEAPGKPGERTSQREFTTCGDQRCVAKSTDACGGSTLYEYDALGRILKTTDPNGVATTSVYDSLNRRLSMRVVKDNQVFAAETVSHDEKQRTTQVVTAKGNTIVLQHDARGRLIQRSAAAPGGQPEVTTYHYDRDRLARIAMPGGLEYSYSYDAAGNLATEEVTAAGQKHRFERRYMPTGKVAGITYPDGSELRNRYSQTGQLEYAGLAEPGKAERTIAGFSSFTPFGRPQAIDYGNAVKETISYNRLGQPVSQAVSSGASRLAQTEVQWDRFHSLAGINDQVKAADSQSFSYDANGRLTQARWNTSAPPAQQELQEFAYDAGGNLTSKNGTTYSYQGHQLVEGRKQGQAVFSAQYDADGAMASAARGGGSVGYRYDALGRLVEVGGARFAYDHAGRRVSKESARSKTYYITADYEVTVFPDGASQTTKYVSGESGRVAQVTRAVKGAAPQLAGVPAAGTSYFHTNLVNSTAIHTDESGAVLATITYQPFGEIRTIEGRDGFRPKFTGKELDQETGLYYFEARYYDPTIGRFLSIDDRPGAGFEQPGTLNRYAYVLNNPITGIDTDGHFRWDIFADVLIAVAAVTLFAAATVATGGAAAALGVVASTFIGAAVSGITYSATHSESDFRWREWGIEVGIGAATGLVTGFVGGGGAVAGMKGFVALGSAGWKAWAFRVGITMAIGSVGGMLSGFVGNSLRNTAFQGKTGWDAVATNFWSAMARGAWQGAVTGALAATPLKSAFGARVTQSLGPNAARSILTTGTATVFVGAIAGMLVLKAAGAERPGDKPSARNDEGHQATQPTGLKAQPMLQFTPLGLQRA